MAKALELARPVMSRGTRLNAYQARRQAGKELEQLPAPDLASDDHSPSGIDAMHLKDGLGDVQANGGDRAHGMLLCRWLLEATMLPHRWVGAIHSIRSGLRPSRYHSKIRE